MLKRIAYLGPVLVLEPLARERVGHADEEDVVLLGDHLGFLEPRLVVRAGETHLQLAERGGPQLFEVQRLRFSSLVHTAPHMRVKPDRSAAATPKGMTKDEPRLFGSPRTIPQQSAGRAVMLNAAT